MVKHLPHNAPIRQSCPAISLAPNKLKHSRTDPERRSARFLLTTSTGTPTTSPNRRCLSVAWFLSVLGDARTGDPRRVHHQMSEVQRRREDGQRIGRVPRNGIHKEERRQPFAPCAQILDCASRPSVPVPRHEMKATHLSAEPALRLHARVSSENFQTGCTHSRNRAALIHPRTWLRHSTTSSGF